MFLKSLPSHRSLSISISSSAGAHLPISCSFCSIFRAALVTMVRVSEISTLKVQDVDSKNMRLMIRQSKGRKDRYTALQGGSIMKGWTNDDRMMIACCNDGTRPVIFKIERIGIPEKDEEETWLQKQNLTNVTDNAYTG